MSGPPAHAVKLPFMRTASESGLCAEMRMKLRLAAGQQDNLQLPFLRLGERRSLDLRLVQVPGGVLHLTRPVPRNESDSGNSCPRPGCPLRSWRSDSPLPAVESPRRSGSQRLFQRDRSGIRLPQQKSAARLLREHHVTFLIRRFHFRPENLRGPQRPPPSSLRDPTA